MIIHNEVVRLLQITETKIIIDARSLSSLQKDETGDNTILIYLKVSQFY
jgi:hypothetical protein